MKRMLLSIVLILCLLAGVALPASAATLTVSEEGLAFIKEFETSFSSSKLASTVSAVNSFLSTNELELNQAQFDALVSLIYDIGTGNLNADYRYAIAMQSECTDAEFATAWCSWVKKGGVFSESMLQRRIREIKLYRYGDYSGSDSDQQFRYVIYNANGGSLEENTVLCYTLDAAYGALPAATKSGSYFAGWYTATSGGEHIHNGSLASVNRTLYASWSGVKPATDPNEPDEQIEMPEIKTSEAGIAFIKEHEGFAKYAMWDVSQWSVGYGTRCGVKRDGSDVPEAWKEGNAGITELEAEYLLRQMLAEQFEPALDAFLAKGGQTLSQQQYDALISFSFNLGTAWMNRGYQMGEYIYTGKYTEMQLVNTMGRWINVNGAPNSGTARRRISEANVFFNGTYVRNSTAYLRIIYDINVPNGESATCNTDYYYYKTGEALGKLPVPKWEGHVFSGWYSEPEGGELFTEATLAPATRNYTVHAHWDEQEKPVDPDPPAEGFTDVPETAWYYKGVTAMVEADIFRGVSETEFLPSGTMNRAMMVTALYRLMGEPATEVVPPFTDVPVGQWYSSAIAWAYEYEMVNGISETVFDRGSAITREQLATLLYRFAVFCDEDVTVRASLEDFEDVASVSSYAVEAMQWAVAEGYIQGNAGRLLPKDTATRAECAVLLARYLGFET